MVIVARARNCVNAHRELLYEWDGRVLTDRNLGSGQRVFTRAGAEDGRRLPARGGTMKSRDAKSC